MRAIIYTSVFCILYSVFCIQHSVFLILTPVSSLQASTSCLLSSIFCLLLNNPRNSVSKLSVSEFRSQNESDYLHFWILHSVFSLLSPISRLLSSPQ